MNQPSEEVRMMAAEVERLFCENFNYYMKLKDPSQKYHLSYGNVISAVNKQIQSKQIQFDYQDTKGCCNFNTHTLKLVFGFYDIKNDANYAYCFAGVYRYSQSLVEFIVAEIKKNPDLMGKIKVALKKTTPGS